MYKISQETLENLEAISGHKAKDTINYCWPRITSRSQLFFPNHCFHTPESINELRRSIPRVPLKIRIKRLYALYLHGQFRALFK